MKSASIHQMQKLGTQFGIQYKDDGFAILTTQPWKQWILEPRSKEDNNQPIYEADTLFKKKNGLRYKFLLLESKVFRYWKVSNRARSPIMSIPLVH